MNKIERKKIFLWSQVDNIEDYFLNTHETYHLYRDFPLESLLNSRLKICLQELRKLYNGKNIYEYRENFTENSLESQE